MNKLEVKIDYIKGINYSLYHNEVPVCKSLQLNK